MTFQDVMSIAGLIVTIAWMVIAYVLLKLQVRTFETQSETFIEQQKITQMSTLKFLYDIRPNFKGRLEYESKRQYREQTFHSYYLKLEGKNIARNVRLSEDSELPDFLEFMGGINEYPFDEEIVILSGKANHIQMQENINMILEYEDDIGTLYNQTIIGSLNFLFMNPPIVIKYKTF